MQKLFLTILSLGLLGAEKVAAAPNIGPTGAPPDSNASTKSFSDVVTSAFPRLTDIILLLGGALAVIYIMWAGIQYITASGNADAAKKARTGIVNGIIGVIVIVAAYAIIRLAVSVGGFLAGLT